MTRLSGAPPARPLNTAFAGLLEPQEKISATLKLLYAKYISLKSQTEYDGECQKREMCPSCAWYLCIPAEAEHDLEDNILKDKVLIVVWNS